MKSILTVRVICKRLSSADNKLKKGISDGLEAGDSQRKGLWPMGTKNVTHGNEECDPRGWGLWPMGMRTVTHEDEDCDPRGHNSMATLIPSNILVTDCTSTGYF